ncbi:MAG: DAK2 domain-containing protein [Clostridia bacterium]|nr:DAK2 domain-containing protein [Clostridia bacterium]
MAKKDRKPIKRVIGDLFHNMTVSAANLLHNHKEEANNMNVFPVPDGDTGINMSLTMGNLEEVSEGLSLGESAEETAGQMLRAARGNSGAILSLFFRGVGKSFHDAETAGALQFVKAFEKGTEEAYRAVQAPAEGTILTVMRRTAEAGRAAYQADKKIDLCTLFDVMVKAAEDTLAHTPDMLPALKEAGVVDAGGYGFVCVLKGMKAALDGTPVVREGDDSGAPVADFASFETADITFAYCTECIIDKSEAYLGEDVAAEEFRSFLYSMGDSVVYAEDNSIIKIHVHTSDPGKVLSFALEFGSLASVKIENMRNQHTGLVAAEEKKKAEENEAVPVTREYGFVSVSMGEGIRELFLDVGADEVIAGGQTMNPSTQDILDAARRIPAKNIFVLPNNKNIRMVAKQAAEMAQDRSIWVIPTETVPEGIAALIAYNPDAGVKENLSAMEDASRKVTTMSVTYAVRDTKVGRFKIAKGQHLGLVENTIACVTDSAHDCMMQLMRGMADATFVMLLYGESVEEKEAESIGAAIRSAVPTAEVSVMRGGQPVYDYVISIEHGGNE